MSTSVRIFLGGCLLVLLVVGGLMLMRPDLLMSSGSPSGGKSASSSQQPSAPEGDASQARPAMVVTVASPKRELLPVQVVADGDVVAWQEASIASESNSLTLAEVLVDVGDTVKRGQVLARFNGRTVAEDVAQAKASLVEAQANAVEARANAERARRLLRTDSMSKQQADQYFAADRSAQARVRSAQAALASRRQNWLNV